MRIVGEVMLMGVAGKLFSGSLRIVLLVLFGCAVSLLPLNLGRKIMG